MFIIEFADGRRMRVEAVNATAARHAAYRVERAQAITSITPAP